MTAIVEVKHKSGGHVDVLVESFDPKTGKAGYPTVRLSEGQTIDVTVHDGNAFRVVEISKIVTSIEKN